VLLYHGRELDIVNQADSVEPLAPMLASLDRASEGIAAIEAIDQLAIDREPNPRLYQQAVGVLRTIAQHPAAMNIPAFYWRLLAAEGLDPFLDGCGRCGADGEQLVSIDLGEGGALCRTCRSGTAISPAALTIMRGIFNGGLRDVLALPESPATHEVATLATRA